MNSHKSVKDSHQIKAKKKGWVWISYQFGAGFGFFSLSTSDTSMTVEISVIGLGETIEAKLVCGSEERGGKGG